MGAAADPKPGHRRHYRAKGCICPRLTSSLHVACSMYSHPLLHLVLEKAALEGCCAGESLHGLTYALAVSSWLQQPTFFHHLYTVWRYCEAGRATTLQVFGRVHTSRSLCTRGLMPFMYLKCLMIAVHGHSSNFEIEWPSSKSGFLGSLTINHEMQIYTMILLKSFHKVRSKSCS